MRKNILIHMILFLVLVAGSAHAGDKICRSYFKLGYLASAPTAEDLDYADADGGSLEQYLQMSKNNYGLGAQFLFDFRETPKAVYRLGFDIGIQTLFSSKFDTGASDLDYIDESYDEDSEYDIYLLGVVEYSPLRSPFFVQAGLGTHFVYWRWEQSHSGRYSSRYDSKSGSATNIGILLAGGMDLQINERITLPIMARIDSIMRYGTATTISLMAGFNYFFKP